MRSLAVVALLVAVASSACSNDNARCTDSHCDFSDDEYALLSSLTNLGDPPPDRSNKYVGNPCAEDLGQRLYFDPGFSGTATAGPVDGIGRRVPYSRAEKGQPLNVSCATCHDLSRSGSDISSEPNQISVGAGWSPVNAGHVVNAQYYQLPFWNGRDDSLWAMVIPVLESATAMGGSRLEVAWRINDDPVYHAEYATLFPDYPLPFESTSAELAARLDQKGRCKLDPDGSCPSDCRLDEMGPDPSVCVPRFPLKGKPGKLAPTCTDDPAHCCQRGDWREPARDAWDCMAKEDKDAINRIIVNYAKAIAAFEYKLISKNALFDQAMSGTARLPEPAVRGARLFVGKASCIECHSTPLLSDSGYHNTGVPQVGPSVPTEADCPLGGACDCVTARPSLRDCNSATGPKEPPECPPWGFYDGLRKLRSNQTWRRYSKFSDDPSDSSRAAFCTMMSDETFKGAFRTPTLRDVALTAPYMHDGVFATLDEVIAHYNRGGSASGAAPQFKSPKMRPLHLTEAESADLVAFLETLSGQALDSSLVSKPAVEPPAGCLAP